MRTFKDIIDYSMAPLVQWGPVVGEKPSEGKKTEDALTHGAVAKELVRQKAQNITGIIADEARMELHIAKNVPSASHIYHLTLSGEFEKAARHNIIEAARKKLENTGKIAVTSDIDSVLLHSQDAVVCNMILGCLACPDAHENITNMLKFSASLLKKGGALIVVRPNPEGGKFPTYECVTPADDLKSGQDYEFIVKGLESEGVMKNLYTPDSFLKSMMKNAGFSMGKTKAITDVVQDIKAPSKKPAFLMNICIFR